MRLVIDRVSKSFRSRNVFRDISAEVRNGQVLGIIGPNGSGKSTLIKITASLMRASQGKVEFEIDGKIINGPDIRPYIGMVSPDLFLYDELTAFENAVFFARMSGLRLSDTRGLFDEFGLSGREHDLVRSYSSGMKQRLKLLIAAQRNPALMLLDEPSNNLDDAGKALVRKLIDGRQGITVMASNDKSEVQDAAVIIDLAHPLPGGSR